MEVSQGIAAALVRRFNLRIVVFWACTLFIAYENLEGSIWSFLRIEYVRFDLVHLGYPVYFLNILGTGELCIAVVLLIPRFPVAKAWAYAGATLNYSAAAASHLSVGDEGRSEFLTLAIICLALTLTSWVLRPVDRRAPTPQASQPRAVAWIVPIALLFVYAMVALLTLPKGVPQV